MSKSIQKRAAGILNDESKDLIEYNQKAKCNLTFIPAH
jgi:hypothetical protein